MIGGTTCDACRNKRQSLPFSFATRPSRAPHKGVTSCVSGKLVTKVLEEHALGNCVQAHEDAHETDPALAETCRRVAKCMERDDGGVPPEDLDPTFPKEMIGGLCASTYDKWAKRNEPNTELRAYSQEAVCLNATINAGCGAGKARASTVGGVTGAGLLGLGGGIGGYKAGETLAPKLSLKPGVAGVLGGVLGAGVGAALGWLLGRWIGALAAGPQGSEEDCKKLQGELDECDKAIKDYRPQAHQEPTPFEPDGRIIKSLIRGIMKPKSAAPGAAFTQPEGPGNQPSAQLAPIAARKAAGSRKDILMSGDLTEIPLFSSTRSHVNADLGLLGLGVAGLASRLLEKRKKEPAQ
jgi:hypothetical protein